MFEPQKFFIGLMDFFTILLPGGALVYLASNLFLSSPFAEREGSGIVELGRLLGDAEPIVVFLFASYLVGHFVFMTGAKILDDYVYDPIRIRNSKKPLTEPVYLAGKLKRACLRWIDARVFPKHPDRALYHVLRIKSRALAPLTADTAINAFQWSKARLSIDHPRGLAEVQRYEANSKFFRSLSVVLAVLAVMYLSTRHFVPSTVCAALLVPVILRYAGQRFKSTEQAYRFIITLSAHSNVAAPTHAGGVVYREQNDAITYLLTQARGNRDHWVLPKGHIEPGEDPRRTAVREVREETGYRARVVRELYDCRLGKGPEAPLVRFYLMELIEGHRQESDEDRETLWHEVPDAIVKSTFAEPKALIAFAERIRRETQDG